ncbi:MAG: hypothetical protein AAF770_03010 [Bacteroidota bacterium]
MILYSFYTPFKVLVASCFLLASIASQTFIPQSQQYRSKTSVASQSAFSPKKLRKAYHSPKEKIISKKLLLIIPVIVLFLVIGVILGKRYGGKTEPDIFAIVPDLIQTEKLGYVPGLEEVHGREHRCHNPIFERYLHKSGVTHEYTHGDENRFVFPHHIINGYKCNLCDNMIPICYYADSVAFWRCANNEAHATQKGFYVCRKCVSGSSKACTQCGGQFSKIFPQESDDLCPPCIGYNQLLAARNQIFDTASLPIRGFRERRDYQRTGDANWSLFSKKIDNPNMIAALTNQMKLFKHRYVYPQDERTWSLEKVNETLDNLANRDELDNTTEELLDLLDETPANHVMICPSYDYVWDVGTERGGKLPESFQEKILGMLNTYDDSTGANKSYLFLLCGYCYRHYRLR